MKKVFLLSCLVITIMLVSCGYSKEDLKRAEYEGYQEGFEEGYDLAKYESKGDIEKAQYELEGEIERLKREYGDNAYEAGYERGYEEGYDDCLEEHGLVEEYSYDPDDPPRIKKG